MPRDRHLTIKGNGPTSRVCAIYEFVFTLQNSQKKEGIIWLKPFVLISSVGEPLNTVLSQERKMGKASDFPRLGILHSAPMIFK